jgi:hypothetical protein
LLVYASIRWADQVAEKSPFIAAPVFASDDFQLPQIPKDVLIAIAQAMGQFQAENLIEYVGHREGRLIRMIANLEGLTAGD